MDIFNKNGCYTMNYIYFCGVDYNGNTMRIVRYFIFPYIIFESL